MLLKNCEIRPLSGVDASDIIVKREGYPEEKTYMRLKTAHLVAAALLVSACAEPPPPRSVQEFVDNSILLEAALVRCAQNRTETRYEAECVNARAAGKIIEAREDAARREQFDAMSDQKLRARRETQAAAAEARRRAAEAQRLQEEAEYLAQIGRAHV